MARSRKPWWQDPAAQEWLRGVQRDLLPKMDESAAVITLYTGKADAKLAVETGFAVLLDKPMIAAIEAGTTAPSKLIAVCDELVEVNMATEAGRASASKRIAEAMQRLGVDDGT